MPLMPKPKGCTQKPSKKVSGGNRRIGRARTARANRSGKK